MAIPPSKPLSALNEPAALSPANRLVFDYWLSLRKDGALPRRADFNPGRIGPALGRLCLFDVKPGEHLVCRLAGSLVGLALGTDLSGMDYRDYTRTDYLETRMKAHEQILSGKVMCNTRAAALTTRRRTQWQELLLPFGDVSEDGTQQIIVAADFRQAEFGEHVTSLTEALGAPVDAQYFRI